MSAPGAGSVGVFGGTFNPVHLGHLRAAEEVGEALGLERVLFVPSAAPPLKRSGPDPIAPASERLAWVRLAVRGNPRFAVEPLELEREGPSYTLDTLEILGGRHGAEKLVFIIGQDAFRELPSWREPERLLTLSSFAVMTRPPITRGRLDEWIPAELAGAFEVSADGQTARHRTAGTRITMLPISALDVSATDIRRRLGEGRSIRYLVPEVVREAIAASGSYPLRNPTTAEGETP